MRRIARPFSLIALVIAALSASTADAIVGSWVVDADATWAAWQDRPEIAKIPAELRDAVKKSVAEKCAAMAIEITPTQMTRTDGARTETSAYTVLSSEGEALTIESTAADGTKSKGRIELHDGRLRIAGVDDAGAATQGTLVLRPRTAADGAPPADARAKDGAASKAGDATKDAKRPADAPATVVTTPSE